MKNIISVVIILKCICLGYGQISYIENSVVVEGFSDGHNVKFVSDSVGYLYKSATYKSVDGGKSWNNLSDEIINSIDLSFVEAVERNFLNDSVIVLNLWNDDIISSKDGGNTWKRIPKPDITEFHNGSMIFVSDSSGFIYDFADPRVWKTVDYGENWQLIFNGDTKLTDFDFSNENIGYVLYEDSLFVTKDGGINWVFQTKRSHPDFYDQFSFDKYFDSNDSLILTHHDQPKNSVKKPDEISNDMSEVLALDSNESGDIAILVLDKGNNNLSAFHFSADNEEWNSIENIFNNSNDGTIQLTNNNHLFVTSHQSTTLKIFELGNFSYIPEMCFISRNESNNNIVNWKSNEFEPFILSYNIYKKVTSSDYELIGNSQGLQYEDTLETSSSSVGDYKVTALFIDSVESRPSEHHSNLLLQAGLGINGEVLLTWNKYVGLDYDEVYVRRGSSLENLEFIATLPSDQFRYTDFNSDPTTRLYRIEFVFESDCPATSVNGRRSMSRTMISNTVDFRENLLSLDGNSNRYTLYPVPTTKYLNVIKSDGEDYEIFDLRGKIIQEGMIQNGRLDVSNLKTGQYLISINNQTHRFTKN